MVAYQEQTSTFFNESGYMFNYLVRKRPVGGFKYQDIVFLKIFVLCWIIKDIYAIKFPQKVDQRIISVYGALTSEVFCI